MSDTHVGERLARIEANQKNQEVQLEKVLVLLDRMVRVEERQQNFASKYEVLLMRVEKAEKELESWKWARRVIAWTSGIVAAVITGWMLVLLNGSGVAS